MQDFGAVSSKDQWKIFDQLLDAVVIVDRERRLYYANESFQHLCNVAARAVSNHEQVTKFIELPEECWTSLNAATSPSENDESASGYREVGYITKSGGFGRTQVYTGKIKVPWLADSQLFFLILRDVTLETRLHAKYKVQIEANEKLITELKRGLTETTFLQRLATDLPIYADTVTLLNAVSARLKNELGFRDAHFFYVPEHREAELEPVGAEKRMGSRLREVVRHVGPILRESDAGQVATSMVFRPFGMFWITRFRPRLERPVVLITSSKNSQDSTDHSPLLQALSSQVGTLLNNRALYFGSITDPLTGVFNRKFFESRFDIEFQAAVDQGSPLSVLLVDIDGLKKINDEFGLAVGDAVLMNFGQMIKRRIRTTDLCARIGGEEFILILPDTSVSDASVVAESIRSLMREISIPVPGGDRCINVTLSCGIAGTSSNVGSTQDLLHLANQALFQAKTAGRNQTRTAIKDVA